MHKLPFSDWKAVALRQVFTNDFYCSLVEGLRDVPWHEATKSFYRQRERNLGKEPYFQELFSAQVRSQIAEDVGRFFDARLDPGFDLAAHKMVAGDYIGPHTDMNKFGEKYRLTVFLNETWSVDKGGVLLTLRDGDVNSVRDAWLPTANNGFLFEITESSYHAVTPVAGDEARLSLIITFKERLGSAVGVDSSKWYPFPLRSDLEEAAFNAEVAGLHCNLLNDRYSLHVLRGASELKDLVRGDLRNTPKQWSYSSGTSMNVDVGGSQPRGSDTARIAAVRDYGKLPPIIIVEARDGSFHLVNGSHRLSYAVDEGLPVVAAVYRELAKKTLGHEKVGMVAPVA